MRHQRTLREVLPTAEQLMALSKDEQHRELLSIVAMLSELIEMAHKADHDARPNDPNPPHERSSATVASVMDALMSCYADEPVILAGMLVAIALETALTADE